MGFKEQCKSIRDQLKKKEYIEKIFKKDLPAHTQKTPIQQGPPTNPMKKPPTKTASSKVPPGNEASKKVHLPTMPQSLEMQINLGVDFGTSISKVCFCRVDTLESSKIDFSPLQPKNLETYDKDPGFIPSVVYLDEKGYLYSPFTIEESNIDRKSLNAPDRIQIPYLKMYLMEADLGHLEPLKKRFDHLHHPIEKLLVTFFLSVLVSAVKDSLKKQFTKTKGPKVKFIWSGNLGIPIAYLKDKNREVFEEVWKVAVALSDQLEQQSTELIHNPMHIEKLEDLYEEVLPSIHDRGIDFFVESELEASLRILQQEISLKDGIYAFVDIGGGTLDSTLFYFHREKGEGRMNFLSSIVHPLGMEVVSQKIRESIALQAIKKVLMEDKKQLSIDFNDFNEVFLKNVTNAIQNQIAETILSGKKKSVSSWKGMQYLTIYLAGGGMSSLWYQKIIEGTYANRQHANCGIPPYKCVSIPKIKINRFLINDTINFHRYLVAYGLSIPKGTFSDPEGFPEDNLEIIPTYVDEYARTIQKQKEIYRKPV